MRNFKGLRRFKWRTSAPWLLGIGWLLGIVLGGLSAAQAEDVLVPLIRDGAGRYASVVGLLATTLLPFLLSAFAVSLSEPWLLLIISTCKAFSFAFCAFGVSLAFGPSGWLVRFLFLFSDLCLIPLLYLYWLRHIRGECRHIPWELPLCLSAALAVGMVDYWFISPFLVSIMN
ncbi:MAG: hypothetical protein IJW14_01200 [Oscillospiraceae bacterium]|nr:hypothetical protein [Oscillospiraceae bacterium]